MNKIQLGDNIQGSIESNTLTLTIDLSQAGVPSKNSGGKNNLVATTRGYSSVPGTNLRISINAIRPAS